MPKRAVRKQPTSKYGVGFPKKAADYAMKNVEANILISRSLCVSDSPVASNAFWGLCGQKAVF